MITSQNSDIFAISLSWAQILQSLAKTQPDHVIDKFRNIGASSNSSGRNSQRNTKLSPKDDSTETQLQLFLSPAENINSDFGRHSFNIGSSTTLKRLFNEYAEKRSVSLRTLRFSFNGKTLFLSAIGNKTPDEMNMKDQDVITVYDTNASHGADSSSSNKPGDALASTKKVEAKKKSSHKAKGKGKKRSPSKREEPVTTTLTLGEYKTHHSILLSKLHEELQPRLKEIRIRLNTLGLECQPPKQKRRSNKKTKNVSLADAHLNQQMWPNAHCGGKAGKPYYIVQVGEVQNLYKTTKPSLQQRQQQLKQHSSSSITSTLDLHGCTKEEAIQQLNYHLTLWEDTAMKGLYPFVIPAKIVCGCGNQILSEVVEEWIRSNKQVANAPKNWVC